MTYRPPRLIAEDVIEGVDFQEFAIREMVKTRIIAAIIERDAYWMERNAKSVSGLGETATEKNDAS